MNEMVDRVARALANTEPQEDDEKHFRAYALAAIAAMRTPTAAMREAGFDAWDDQANSERVLSAWHSMIDEALAD